MRRVLKIVLGTVVAVVLVGAFAVFVLQIPMPWKARAGETKRPAAPRPLSSIEMVEGQPYTVMLPDSVRRSLGIRQNGIDVLHTATPPTQRRSIVMLGSTALDPARIMRIRARFAPAEVVSIAEVEDRDKPPELSASVPAEKHELRPGDEITPSMELATFYSPDVGNKKNDLFEAIVQLRLDEIILKKAEDAGGSLPDIYLWTARRNVDTDRSAVRRARNTLLTWGVDAADIAAVVKEANVLKITGGKREELSEKEMTAKDARWARVVLKAPEFVKDRFRLTEKSLAELRAQGLPEALALKLGNNLTHFEQFESCEQFLEKLARLLGNEETERFRALLLAQADVKPGEPAVVIERNVSKGEVVVDNTVNLFTLARVDQLLVYANCPEDDLPEFYRLRKTGQMKWTIQTVGTEKNGVEGTITEIGWLIDPNQHTAVIKGYIPNPGGKIRAGQFATATVELLPLQGVVEIPAEALVEDGQQSVVFVQSDPEKHHYTMRRVEVVSRLEKNLLVRSKDFEKHEQLTDEERKLGLLPREALKEKDKVLTAGVLELKAAVTEKEASRRATEAQRRQAAE
jgi:multidrug efflux pump subunit AcrA (membrane-fusion protein)